MASEDTARFVAGLQEALRKERATNRIYRSLAEHEKSEACRILLPTDLIIRDRCSSGLA